MILIAADTFRHLSSISVLVVPTMGVMSFQTLKCSLELFIILSSQELGSDPCINVLLSTAGNICIGEPCISKGLCVSSISSR